MHPFFVNHFKKYCFTLCLCLSSISVCATDINNWTRHSIDHSSQGADGIRIEDINHDGRLDLVTGWEEGGIIRIYYNPGKLLVRNPWPMETIAEVNSPEDAVFIDLNGDYQYEVISSCEGQERSVYLHAYHIQQDGKRFWHTEAFPVLQNKAAWMFCLPMNVDDRFGNDLVIGAKGTGAELGWLKSPEDPFQLDQWTWHPFLPVTWVMSIEAHDMDSDGDLDILVSDRKPDHQSVFWLERPDQNPHLTDQWTIHEISQSEHEFLFLDYADLDQDGFNDIVVATPKDGIIIYRGLSVNGNQWEQYSVNIPETFGNGKAVRIFDWNLDGKNEIVFTCEGAKDLHGVGILSPLQNYWGGEWEAHSISGLEGNKYDLIQLIDLDEDGDLDVLTCEERENLGVIWYENPFIH